MLPDIQNQCPHLFCLFLNKTQTTSSKYFKSCQTDMSREAQGNLQSFLLSCPVELLTGLSHHHITLKITSETAYIFHCKAERWKRFPSL